MRLLKIFLYTWLPLLLALSAAAQVTITGPTCVMQATTVTYTVTGVTNPAQTGWGVGGTNMGGTSNTINILWGQVGQGSVNVIIPGTSTAAILNVTVAAYGTVGGGTITSPVTNLSYGDAPGAISSTSLALSGSTGACAALAFSYQWQQSFDNVNFTDVAGATDPNKYIPELIFRNTYVRRAAIASTATFYSNVISFLPNQEFTPGSISPVSTMLNVSSSTINFTAVDPPRGGCTNGAYTYQWQKSTDNTTFVDIAGATAASYAENVGSTCYFRRAASCGGQTVFSNIVSVIKVFSQNYNYIRKFTSISPSANINEDDPVPDFGPAVQQNTQFLDGLGRNLMTVGRRAALVTGQSATDLISPNVYDQMGRQADKYLSYADNVADGGYKDNLLTNQKAFYNTLLAGEPGESPTAPADAPWAYAHTVFEKSPLDRSKESAAPGVNNVGTAGASDPVARHSAKVSYLNNIANDNLRIWNVTNVADGFGTYATPGAYQAGQLSKTISSDEAGNQTVEFTDKSGKLILRRSQLAGSESSTANAVQGWICTLYIYDDMDQLRCIVQPEGYLALYNNNWVMTQTILDEQCFRYEYDSRGSTIRKKIPGGITTEMVYDQRNRLVMSQDPNLKAAGKWNVNLYDGQNRVIQTGLWTDGRTQVQHTAAAISQANYPFAATATPGTGYERLTQIGFDDYNTLPSASGLNNTFDNTGSDNFISASLTVAPFAETPIVAGITTGKVTWQEIEVLGSNPVKYLYNVNLYDAWGRLIQVKSTNITGGVDVASTQYSWHGLPLLSVQKQQQAVSPAVTSVIVTRTTYDDLERPVKTEKRLQNTLVNSNAMGAYFTTQEMTYDALGHLKTTKIGQSKDGTGLYSGVALETLTADYGVTGKLLGVNRKYLSGAASNYFGFELGYDKVANNSGRNFSQAFYDGNISGTVWKSKGNGIARKYDYKYDKSDRLLSAVFEQLNPDATWGNGRARFDQVLGDGVDPSLAYDLNGNIKRLQNWGLKSGASTQIDNLTYTYISGSNKLRGVAEASGSQDNKLGDFTDKNTTADDYGYDPNGNLVTDLNKRINGTVGSNVTTGGGITFNQLNLPLQINVKDDAGNTRGTISYVYDANGTKLSRTVVDQSTTGKTLTTIDFYVGGAIYESFTNSTDATANYSYKLISIPHEQGRIRFKPAVGSVPARFDVDYFIKDNLGNVRMVLTDENQTDTYQATMEPAQAAFETALFGTKISSTLATKPTGFDTDGANTKVSVTNAATDAGRVGPGVILKVMAGDKINAKTYAWYQPSGMDNTTNTTLPALITSLLGQLAPGIGSLGKGTSAEGITSANLQPGLQSLLNTQTPATNAPRAYLNFVLLDEERFEYVTGNVAPVPQITGTQPKQLLQLNGGADITIPKNGYVYVYVSNESKGNVYFDDIRVDHKRGPLLEETHYYPYGLTMAGISSRANKGTSYQENRLKYNGIEFDGNLDFNAYEAEFRNLDPQTGRWSQVDPKVDQGMEDWSPYASNYANPIRFSDINGDEPGDGFWSKALELATNIWNGTRAAANGVVVGATDNVFGTNLRAHYADHVKADNDKATSVGWNTGLDVADVGSLIGGGTEMTGGAAIVAGGGGATLVSGGTISIASVPAMAGGAALAGHGTFVITNAGVNLLTQNGRVNIEGEPAATSSDKPAEPSPAPNSSISEGDMKRIQNASNRIQKPITIVGSRARGTATPASDWDYVIDRLTNGEWKKIKNSLPGAKSSADNLPRQIDILSTPLDPTKSNIPVKPTN